MRSLAASLRSGGRLCRRLSRRWSGRNGIRLQSVRFENQHSRFVHATLHRDWLAFERHLGGSGVTCPDHNLLIGMERFHLISIRTPRTSILPSAFNETHARPVVFTTTSKPGAVAGGLPAAIPEADCPADGAGCVPGLRPRSRMPVARCCFEQLRWDSVMQ